MPRKPRFLAGMTLALLVALALGTGFAQTAFATPATITMTGTWGNNSGANKITVPLGAQVTVSAIYSSGTCPTLLKGDNGWWDNFISPGAVSPSGSASLAYPKGTTGPCQQGYASYPPTYTFNNTGTYVIQYQLWTAKRCNKASSCTPDVEVMTAFLTVCVGSCIQAKIFGLINGQKYYTNPLTVTVGTKVSFGVDYPVPTSCPTLPAYANAWYNEFDLPGGSTVSQWFPGGQGPCQTGSAAPQPAYTFTKTGTFTIDYLMGDGVNYGGSSCDPNTFPGYFYCTLYDYYVGLEYVVQVVKAVPVQSLQITASLNASTCVPDTVTVTALDPQGNPVATTGTLNLATTSGHGNWTLVSGNGTFTPGPADSGTATYQYAAADNGTAQFALADVHADNLTINGTLVTANPPRTIVGQSGTVQFRDNAFVFTQTTPPADGAGVVVAGRAGAFRAEMIRRDPTSGNCGPAPGYDVNSVKAWIQRSANDPGGNAPTISGVALGNAAPAANNLPIAFSNGVANFSLATTDVGQYSIDFEDNTSGFAQNTNGSARPIIGSSNVLTVRPFALAFSAIQAGATANPGGTTPTSAVFTVAGRSFSATLEAVLWQSGDPANGIPTGPVNAAGRSVTPHFAWATALSAVVPFTPAQGTLGALTGGSLAQSDWSGGAATATQASYSEVGSVTLQAAAKNYLGSVNAIVGGSSTPVGRFIPDHFAVSLNTPQFATACTSSTPGFTYLGQPFFYQTKPVATLTAENVQGGITKNYYNFTRQGGADWFRLKSLPATVYTDAGGHPIDTAGLTANGANPVIANPSPGVATLNFSAGAGLDYTRPAPPATPEAPFNASPTLSQQVVDLDGVKSTPDPVTFSAILFSGGASLRYGRIRLQNAYGSELLALPVPMQAQYYLDADNGFVTNTADSCTTGITLSLSNYQGGLSAGETQASLAQPPTAGIFKLSLSPPGAGNTGSVSVTAKVPSWLQYDWKSNQGTAALINPTALAAFGLYEGSPYQIFLQEIY